MGDEAVVPGPDRTGPPPWWWGLPPLDSQIDCAGHRHRVRWAEGRLDLLEHGDPDRERALGALAGQQSGCLRLYDAWHRHAADPTVLVLTSRGPADPVSVPADADDGPRSTASNPGGAPMPAVAPGSRSVGWTAYRPMPAVYRGSSMPRRMAHGRSGPGGDGGDGGDDDLSLLLGLGAPWTERLAATVIAALLDGSNGGAAAGGPPVALRAALYGRALAALRAWTGRAADLDLAVAPGPDEAAIDLDADPVRAALPVRWLLDVWARGVAVVLGRFCLAAEPDPDGRQLALTTVAPGGTRATITLQCPGPTG